METNTTVVKVRNTLDKAWAESGQWALTFFRLTRDDNGIAENIVWVTKTSGQNPARPLKLRGAAARGALTFFRLTREDNGIA